MTLRDTNDIDRLFERLANAEAFLGTAKTDLQRLGLVFEAGAIEGTLAKVREVSNAVIVWEEAHRR